MGGTNQGDPRGGPGLYGLQGQQRAPARNPIDAVLLGLGQRRDRSQFVEAREQMISMGADRLSRIGTSRSQKLAEQLRQNPRGFMGFVNQFGGMPLLEQGLMDEAQRESEQAGEQDIVQARLSFEDLPEDEQTPEALQLHMLRATGSTKASFTAAERFQKLQPEPEEYGDPLFQLMEEHNRAVKTGEFTPQQLALAEERMKKLAVQSGMSLRVGPDGTVEFAQGAGADLRTPGELTRGTKGLVQEDAYKLGAQMQSLRNVRQQYDPAYQQLPTQAVQTIQSWKEWLGGELSPEDRLAKQKYSAYRSDVFDQLNKMLNMLSGAAVSEHEMGRLKESMPHAGDSPADFEGKIIGLQRRTAQATARANYVLSQGLVVNEYALGDMPGLMGDMGDKYADDLAARGVPDAQISSAVDALLLKQFGVTYNEVRYPWGE